jgi:hypothetical protein
MAAITTRSELKDYCLRKLGSPVIEINVSEDQLEDRIDDALLYFKDFHADGTEKLFFRHIITNSTVEISGSTGAFSATETLIGETSGSRLKYYGMDETDPTLLKFTYLDPYTTVVVGENLIGNNTGYSAVIEDEPTLGDIDNKFVPIPDHIISVLRILPFYSLTRSGSNYMFDPQYQMILDNMRSFNSYDLVGYQLVRQQLNLLQELFVGKKPIRFNRHTNQLHIDFDWHKDVIPGSVIVLECWSALNPEEWPDVYNDMFLREYTTALIKLQWGQNLSKFDGVQLPGGVTLNGLRIIDEAKEEITTLRERMHTEFVLPPDFMIG